MDLDAASRMRRGNGRNGRSPSSQPARLPPLLRRLLPPTTGGRRAVALVVCLSLFLYLTLVEPYYAQRQRNQQRQQEGSSSPPSSSSPPYEALGSSPLTRRHHRRAGEHFGQHDCLAADVVIPATPLSPPETSEMMPMMPRPIPLLATNLDLDTEGYLTRLVDGGWYAGPSGAGVARHKLVVAGGCDALVLSQLEALKAAHPDLTVFRQREPLGCAAGWNRILDFFLFNEGVEWAMIFNTDVYVPPGALETLAAEVWAAYDRDPLLCRGFFIVTAGQDAVVFVYTRHALATLGKFDENIYPAYYEDYDMDLRHNRTALCSEVARFSSATLHHGPLNSTEYKSGTSVMRDRMRQQQRPPPPMAAQDLEGEEGEAVATDLRERERELANRIERGFRSSRMYVSQKWGCDEEQAQCAYLHPFNDPTLPLSYWRLDWERRQCIQRRERRVRGCRYTLDRPLGPLPHPPLDEQARPTRKWLRGW